ncbi:hypothetical protein Patl1_11069 [Pistacia atlantica]|uniref:Uncharacterized protein n=1 Tax=Pistacia atlantica TaxID=434234 RepID=A0ACC1A6B7_9ROSI|nr:hypothetical protein Patl1_11069 [Pistacia atlantica]
MVWFASFCYFNLSNWFFILLFGFKYLLRDFDRHFYFASWNFSSRWSSSFRRHILISKTKLRSSLVDYCEFLSQQCIL